MDNIETEPSRKNLLVMALLFFLAFIVRLIHNSMMMESPLYFTPMGGHVPFLLTAREIFSGNFFPLAGAFTENSPYFPYLLAGLYTLSGGENFFIVRLFDIFADSLTCVIIFLLARRYFGFAAGVTGGILAAFYGPMIFYSAELVGISSSLFLLTLSVYLLETENGNLKKLMAGLLAGVATGLMPSLAITVLFLALFLILFNHKNRVKASALFAIGVAIALSPITLHNYIKTERFIPLTLAAGHNFYIGHNPTVGLWYSLPTLQLPDGYDKSSGSIFDLMKASAETVENRKFMDHEVSPYYFKKGLSYITEYPLREAKKMAKRALSIINHFEAGTYSDYNFSQYWSQVTRWAITISFIIPFAFVGFISAGKRLTASLIPIVTTALTILLFFNISRLRMPMTPFLIIFAAGGIFYIARLATGKSWKRFGIVTISAAFIFAITKREMIKEDTSNEWNKVGLVWTSQKRYKEAEWAYKKAIEANSKNRNNYLNLSVLYKKVGRPDQAKEAEAAASKSNGN